MSGTAWVKLGAILGFLAVALGAFGAHALKPKLQKLETAAVFQTAVNYHMYHALALMAVGALARPGVARCVAGYSFVGGVLLFSGSLYVLAVTGERWIGRITPFGGGAFLVGWVALAIAAGSGSKP